MIEFHQVFPGVAPGTRTMKGAVGIAAKPFRMVVLQPRTPAGVVDGQIQKEPGASQMHGIRQFAELFHRRAAFVEHHQRRINGGEIGGGIRRTEAAEAGVGGGGGIDGQQMQDAAFQGVDDVRHLGGQIPQGP